MISVHPGHGAILQFWKAPSNPLHGLNAQTARAREDLQRIFGPLFSTKKGSGGTALRLSITNGVFPVLGGQISVASDLGNGATVMVTLLVGTREV